jgi:hypothetical protein
VPIRLIVHAAKVPESAQSLSKEARRLLGVEMVNACDDKPWQHVPIDFPREDVAPCQACALIVRENRRRSENSASI